MVVGSGPGSLEGGVLGWVGARVGGSAVLVVVVGCAMGKMVFGVSKIEFMLLISRYWVMIIATADLDAI